MMEIHNYLIEVLLEMKKKPQKNRRGKVQNEHNFQRKGRIGGCR